jgi:hypothetical protein
MSSVVALLTAALQASSAAATGTVPVGQGPRHARRDPVGERMLGVVACEVFDTGPIHRISVGLGLADHASSRLAACGADAPGEPELGGWEGTRAGQLVAASCARRRSELRVLAHDWLGQDAEVVGGAFLLVQLAELTTELALVGRPGSRAEDVSGFLRRWGLRVAAETKGIGAP